jgi:histidinol-phosphatase (PHP family)
MPDQFIDAPLLGTWFIVRTSLPLWRRRDNPAVTYAPLPDGAIADLVTWRTGERSGVIVGQDRRDGADWVWRGVGPLTRRLSSRWRVLATDPKDGWALVHFDKTLVTGEGLDLYARRVDLDAEAIDAAFAVLASEGRAARFATRLFTPKHDAPRQNANTP